MRASAFAEKLDAQGLIPVFDTPADAAAALRRERALLAAFIRRNGITAD